jgi:hypothetical protein
LPSDLPGGVRAARPAVYAVRAAAATLRAFTTGMTPTNAAKKMFGHGDQITEYILRSASAPAETTVSGWAQELARVAIYDFVQSITSLSAGAAIIDRALHLNMDGIAEARVPGRVLNAAAAGQWVAESESAPVRSLGFSNAAILRPRKLQVISVVTREMAKSSNIEAVVRQTLGEATGLALDAQMFSANAASATAPAGLFTNTPPLTATAGGGSAAMESDLKNLFAALAAVGGGKTAVIAAALPQAVTLKMTVGPKFDYDILASTALPAGTVTVVEVASFVSGFGSTAEFDVTEVGAVHMEDSSPQNISGGSPSPAVPTRSLFQIDALALKSTLWASWGLRAVGHCQWILGATW